MSHLSARDVVFVNLGSGKPIIVRNGVSAVLASGRRHIHGGNH